MKAYRIVSRGDSRSLADFRNGNQMWAVEVMDGEVWRARDTKLQREVAITKLPEEFAKDADRLPTWGFERTGAGSLIFAVKVTRNHLLRRQDLHPPSETAA